MREDYLHQNAFHEVDTYTSLNKQYRMLKLIIDCYRRSLSALEGGAALDKVLGISAREKIGRSKYIPEERIAEFDGIDAQMSAELAEAAGKESD